jgi:non-homologous end joining protein Ku
MKVDAESGEEINNDDIIKGYPVDRENYIPVLSSNRRSSKTTMSLRLPG